MKILADANQLPHLMRSYTRQINNLLSVTLLSAGVLIILPLRGIDAKPTSEPVRALPTKEVQPDAEPVNTANAVADLKEIYRCINIFKAKYDGRYPENIVASVDTDYKSYGFKNRGDAFQIFTNPDAEYSSSPFQGMSFTNTVVYYFFERRPDGSPLGATKPIGAMDVLSCTDLYYHPATMIKGELRGAYGDYVVLWDNGDVNEVPFDRTIFVPVGDSYQVSFVGQADIPYDSLSYEELFSPSHGYSSLTGYKPSARGQTLNVIDNGGPNALVSFSRLIDTHKGYGVEYHDLWKIFDTTQAEFTLADVQAGATKLGLDTQVQKQSLSQLQQSGSPALLSLNGDGRIITLTSLDDDRALVVDRGLTRNVKRSVLEARYSGEVLVPTKALTQSAGIVADDAVRSVQLSSLNAEVPQQFTLRNTGTKPVTLQLEYPLLGVTDSKLSRDTLAPGETATLDLKVKWRSILKAPKQNVLVSLQTSDPIVPRLQLAVLLNPPQVAGK